MVWGLHHGPPTTKVGAWMPRTVGVVLAHKGVGHRAQGLLTLHNRMGDAGINDESKQNKNTQKGISIRITQFRRHGEVAHAHTACLLEVLFHVCPMKTVSVPHS